MKYKLKDPIYRQAEKIAREVLKMDLPYEQRPQNQTPRPKLRLLRSCDATPTDLPPLPRHENADSMLVHAITERIAKRIRIQNLTSLLKEK